MTDNEVEFIKKEYDALCATRLPSVVMSDIAKFQTKHLQKVSHEYGRFINQFELQYDLITGLFLKVNYIEKTDWPKHRWAQLLFFVHNLKSLYSSFERLVSGFYEDSFILARPAYEAFIKSTYINCEPKDPFAIISDRKVGKEKFRITKFIRDDLKLAWHDYKLFSSWTHANQFSVLKEAIDIHRFGQTGTISLKFKFDQKLFELGINDLNFLLLVNLKSLVSLFATKTNDVLKPEMLEDAYKLIDLNEKNLLNHPKDYWPLVIKDTRDIFELIKRADAGIPWKDAWKEIRKESAL